MFLPPSRAKRPQVTWMGTVSAIPRNFWRPAQGKEMRDDRLSPRPLSPLKPQSDPVGQTPSASLIPPERCFPDYFSLPWSFSWRKQFLLIILPPETQIMPDLHFLWLGVLLPMYLFKLAPDTPILRHSPWISHRTDHCMPCTTLSCAYLICPGSAAHS